jgi:hypothetical protein
MASQDFPDKLYVTIAEDTGDDESFPVANLTVEEAVGSEREPVEIAEYAFIKSFKARATVEMIEED